jgi:hypothetical protein
MIEGSQFAFDMRLRVTNQLDGSYRDFSPIGSPEAAEYFSSLIRQFRDSQTSPGTLQK